MFYMTNLNLTSKTSWTYKFSNIKNIGCAMNIEENYFLKKKYKAANKNKYWKIKFKSALEFFQVYIDQNRLKEIEKEKNLNKDIEYFLM